MAPRPRLRLLAGAATGIGLVAVAAPGTVRRSIGMRPEPAADWALRTFGIRELGLAALLWRATAPSDPAQVALRRVVTAIQVGDAISTGWLALRGRGSWRLWVPVAAGALATIAISGWPGRGHRRPPPMP
ncbi:MAG TPA: hypothetical protein VFD49_19980 [Candidatus Dormibacteraeota bacterium]|nr:hypothetical protein [Candidatus Dormibacteraeota bacterium]